jgi:hypothetical protein
MDYALGIVVEKVAVRKRNKKVAVPPCPEPLGGQDARQGEIALWATCGPPEVRAEAGVAGGCGDVDEQKPVGLSVLSPLCKRCGRCAKLTTHSISQCGPLRLRNRGLRATFLLRFHDRQRSP